MAKRKHIEDLLFTEKYRPKTINDMILPDRIKSRFEKGLQGLTRILLYSDSPGTGKSSLAKVIVNEFKHPHLYINASRDSSVDVLREQITDFCAVQSMETVKNKNMKVVILDEIDGASMQFHKALRASMDEFKHVGFIATCNYYSKIPEAIKSRFDNINFTFTDEDQKALKYKYAEKLIEISKAEGLAIDKSGLQSLIPKYFPDMRSMLNLLQKFKTEGIMKISQNDVVNTHSLFDDLFSLPFQDDAPSIYKLVMENYASKVETLMSAFFTDFPKYVEKEKPEYYKFLPHFVVKIAEYQSKKNQVIDPPLAAIAMIYELQMIVKGGK